MADTTVKITEEVRDHLREAAEERGITTRALIEQLAASVRTQAQIQAAVASNLAVIEEAFGVTLTGEDHARAERVRYALRKGTLGTTSTWKSTAA